MCKVLIIPGIKKETRAKAVKFIKEMGKEMSSGNNDGLGYAAINESGGLFGQRWLVNKDAFIDKALAKVEPPKSKLKAFEKALATNVSDDRWVPGESNEFSVHVDGKIDLANATAVTLHTRMATSPKNMMNVHPFVYPEADTSLIHNGVVRNDDKFEKKVSTCDSEAILTSYLDQGVNLNPEKMKEVAEGLNAYYACGVFSRNADGARILDVFKGNSANLYMQEIKELDTYVFATNDDDVKRVCERLGFTKGESIRVLEGKLIRINPFTGELMSMSEFRAPAMRYESSYSGYSSDRGSHSRTSTNTTRSNFTSWGSSQGNGSNAESDDQGDGMGTVVDVSDSGRGDRQLTRQKTIQGSMSQSMLTFMKQTPHIRELSRQEVHELGKANKWWNGRGA